MTTEQEQIVRVLSEATEPLFVSEIADSLNAELSSGPAFEKSEVMQHLQSLYNQVVLLQDGRWTLRRRMR